MSDIEYALPKRVEFTKEMRGEYTILVPNMAKIHFAILGQVLRSYGYNIEILENESRAVVDAGLKYVHNDTCYPALLVVGQMMDALNSGKYDLSKTALLITQTCGGCRASNYLHLLRKALAKAGMAQVPVISVNVNGIEKHSGFEITVPLMRKMVAAVAYGDLLMLLANQTRPYEVTKGSTDRLVKTWVDTLIGLFAEEKGYSKTQMAGYFKQVVESFAALKLDEKQLIKVGIVGEIYVKFASLGNNGLEELLAGEGCEVMVPGLLEFLIYTIDAPLQDMALYGGGGFSKLGYQTARSYLCKIKDDIANAVKKYSNFKAPASFDHLKKGAGTVIGPGNKMGEGWLLPGEMIELVEMGYPTIICVQPFGCLPNHIAGKGEVRNIKTLHPTANIVPVDYDPGATRVNQENRIKLMLAVAAEGLQNENSEGAKAFTKG